MREIIHRLHYTVVKYSALKYPIMLDIGETSFNDKLVYIVLECVIHIVMEKYHRKVFAYQDYCDKKYFSDKYSEKDFYNISSFQDKISGSIQKDKTGGRALFFYADHMRFNKEEFKIINEKIEAIYKCVNDAYEGKY